MGIQETQAKEILRILDQSLALPTLVKPKSDPFKTLVITILSQNTADRNTSVAFKSLQNNFKITPQALANAQIKLIEDAIRTAGLYKSKANAINQASKTILEKYHGNMQSILSLPLEEARKTLMRFSGVGPKTADVVLLFSAKQPTIPIDTHVNRVSKRLGLAPAKGDYEAVRKSLQELYPENDYLKVHLLLISHGRRTCKASRPLCKQCLINKYCISKDLENKL